MSPFAFCHDEGECGGVKKVVEKVGMMEEGRNVEVDTNKCQVDTTSKWSIPKIN